MKWNRKICAEYIQQLKDPMAELAQKETPVGNPADIGLKLKAMATQNTAGVTNGNNNQNTPAVY